MILRHSKRDPTSVAHAHIDWKTMEKEYLTFYDIHDKANSLAHGLMTLTPSIDQALHQFLTLLLIFTLVPNLTFYLVARGFHRTFATGAACQ